MTTYFIDGILAMSKHDIEDTEEYVPLYEIIWLNVMVCNTIITVYELPHREIFKVVGCFGGEQYFKSFEEAYEEVKERMDIAYYG